MIDIRLLAVDAAGNTRHPRYFCKSLHQLLTVWKCLSIDNEADHDLACTESITDQYMAHQSAVIFFIIWFDMFHLHKFQNCVQDFFILF